MRIVTFWLAIACSAATAPGGDWPHWRGPQHDGVSDDTGFQKSWSQPIPLVWERNVGSAFSSFAIVGDRLYTGGTAERQQTLLCLNAQDGRVLWTKSLEKEYVERMGGDGPRATPTVDDGRVYMLGAFGTLVCVNAEDGREIWTRRLRHAPRWGYSASVLIEGDLAIVSAGEGDGALLALNKRTGRPVWTCGNDPAGYATPYPFTHEGRRYIAGFMGVSCIIADASSGKLAARFPWQTDWNVNASTPIYHDGKLFLSSGYNHGCVVLELNSRNDRLDLAPAWQSKSLRNKFQTPVLYQGHLFSSDEQGLKCVEFATGSVKWEVRRAKHGTVLIADGHLLFLSEEGHLQIAPATPAGFSPLTDAEILSDRCWTAPVLHDGRIYARSLVRLVCFDLRQK